MSIIGGKIIDYNNVNKISVSTGSSKIIINPDWNETLDYKLVISYKHKL